MALSLIPTNTKINFIGMRRICYGISLALIIVGIVSLFTKGGLSYGVDFGGGTNVQIKFSAPVSDEAVKKALASANIPNASAQTFGKPSDGSFLIKIPSTGEETTDFRAKILAAFGENFKGITATIERVEMVGPKVGNDLRTSAINALYYASLLIAIYVSGRFEQRWGAAGIMAGVLIVSLYTISTLFSSLPHMYLIATATLITLALCFALRLIYALAALLGLVHDILITIGLVSILNIEVDLILIAALLTVIGYSLNDTIIVFDRIRENLHKKSTDGFDVLINNSVNQTLSRTILTSATTVMVLLALFFLGGPIIHNFALVMIAGVVIGTYSSIFISSPILLAFGKPNQGSGHDEGKRIKEIMHQSRDGAIV